MEYKDGEKVGTWTQWDETGAVIKQPITLPDNHYIKLYKTIY